MGPEELRQQAALEDRHFWYAARREQVRLRLPRAYDRKTWALDLGAGSGGNTRLLKEAGYLPLALERHPFAAELTRSRGHAVVQGNAEQLPLRAGSVGLVLACDVLEHLSNDSLAVAEISRVLAPGGRLLLTVPADPRLWSSHDVALEHVRRYTRDSLARLLEIEGFRVDELSSWMVLLRPLVLARRRMAQRSDTVRGGAGASDLIPVPAPVNWALSLVLRLEKGMGQRLARRPGVSLIAMVSKSSE